MINFIVNVKSGKGRGLKSLKKIIDFCFDNKIEYTVHITASQGHAERIARTLCEQGAHTLVAVGGDGTFHEVVNGIRGYENIPVGFIPSGRGNDFARVAGLSLKPKKALKAIVDGETKRVDLFDVGGRCCLNIAGTGLDVAVLKAVEGKSNKISYLFALLKLLFQFKAIKLTTKSGDFCETHDAIMVGVCNGQYFGGGLRLSPESQIDDGKLNVIIVRMPEDGKLTKPLAQFKKGKHLGKDYVIALECEEASVTADFESPIQLDGEIYDNIPFDCKIIKGGLLTFKV